jgi:hypothetical protein
MKQQLSPSVSPPPKSEWTTPAAYEADAIAALRKACQLKDSKWALAVNSELAEAMPWLSPVVERPVIKIIDDAFGEQSEEGGDATLKWQAQRDAHPEKEAFDVAVLEAFYMKRRLGDLGARLEAAKPNIAAAKAKPEGLSERLAAAKPKIGEPKAEPLPQPVIWKPKELSAPPVVSAALPMKNAKGFARDRLFLISEAHETLGTWFYHDEWWQWNGRFYEHAPERRILDLVYNYLDDAVVETQEGDRSKLPLKPRHVDDLIKCLKSRVGLHDKEEPPRWLDDRHSPKAENLFVFRNCMVDATTGKTYDLDPCLWFHDGAMPKAQNVSKNSWGLG